MSGRPSVTAAIRQVDDRLVKRAMRLLLRLGIAPRAFAMLETTGRRSGLARQTPVGNGLVGETFWFVAARGMAADYVRNLLKEPAVRVRIGRRWYSGVATVVPDDDPDQRLAYILRHFGILRRLDAKALAASIRMQESHPCVVRIDHLLDAPVGGRRTLLAEAMRPRTLDSVRRQEALRVNVRCVTRLGDETASTS